MRSHGAGSPSTHFCEIMGVPVSHLVQIQDYTVFCSLQEPTLLVDMQNSSNM